MSSTIIKSSPTRPLPVPAVPVMDPLALAESAELGISLTQAESAKRNQIAREERERLEAFHKRIANLD